MGTSQFGNMLVLCATYNSDIKALSDLVPKKALVDLLDRTIRFLRLSKDISPVLAKDAELLEHIKATLFPSPRASLSFSST